MIIRVDRWAGVQPWFKHAMMHLREGENDGKREGKRVRGRVGEGEREAGRDRGRERGSEKRREIELKLAGAIKISTREWRGFDNQRP